jgi:hypothetical protein
MEENTKDQTVYITVPVNHYTDLKHKAHGFKLQSELIDKIRKEFKPTEKQKRMPYYEMILELIKTASND